MRIDQMSSKQENRFVTVTMSYEDVRDTANALYYATTGKKPETDCSEIFAKFSFLFDMVKYGMVQKNTVQKLADITDKNAEEKTT